VPGPPRGLRKSAETLQVSPASDIPFENLPEVFQYGYQRLLTLGRRSADSFDRQALEGAEPVASIVAALLERDALQNAMRERKLVERAKGLLQKKERISEENAYLLLRKVSRYRRISDGRGGAGNYSTQRHPEHSAAQDGLRTAVWGESGNSRKYGILAS
jgi:hypothetical protein